MSKYAILRHPGWWNDPRQMAQDTRTLKWWARRDWSHRKRVRNQRRRGVTPTGRPAIGPAAVAAYNRHLAKLRRGLSPERN